jgi:hypothetical protein
MLGASQAIAAASEYEEVRDLTLSAAGINGLEIEAGGGRLEIGGDSGLDEIVVTATIVVPGREAEKAREVIESDLTLTLEKSGKNAVLRSYFDYRGRGDSPIVHLDVRMPSQLELEVEDGSGHGESRRGGGHRRRLRLDQRQRRRRGPVHQRRVRQHQSDRCRRFRRG